MRSPSASSFAVAGLLAVIVFAYWFISDRPASVPSPSTPTVIESSPAQPSSFQPVAMAVAAILPDLPPPKPRIVHSPEAVKAMEDVQFMLRDFRARLGGNPTGTNAEIMKELMGGNRVNAAFGPPQGETLNEQGELLDRWGTAYFFHQLSRTEMEIRSAGPDRVMWTNDDIVMK